MKSIASKTRVAALGAMLLGSCALTSSTCAAPLTLLFDATIGPPRQGITGDLLLPFSFQEGDQIQGRFTVEPLELMESVVGSFVVQPNEVQFSINGHSFGVNSYLITIEDDIMAADTPPHDRIRLRRGYCGSDDCTRQLVDGPNSAEFSFSINFFGPTTALSSETIPTELTAWEDFDLSPPSVLISFRNEASTQFDGLLAHISRLREVPEPSGTCLCLALIFLVSIQHRGIAMEHLHRSPNDFIPR